MSVSNTENKDAISMNDDEFNFFKNKPYQKKN